MDSKSDYNISSSSQNERRTPPPIQPDHSGLQVVDNSGLEVVPVTEAPLPPLPPHQHDHHQWGEKATSTTPYGSTQPSAGGYLPGFVPRHNGSPALSTAHTATASEYLPRYHHQAPPPDSPSLDKTPRYCGLKRQAFIILLALLVFVAVIAVALGVGLGIGLHKSDSSSTTTATPTTTGFVTGTTTLPAATATATLSASGTAPAVTCPDNNMTLYDAAFQKTFLLLCGRDYNYADGTTDMFHQATDSMGECIQTCANNTGCVGAGWGYINGQYTCWLKRKLGRPNSSESWYFAIKEEGGI